jgi:hypothetical protein
MHSCCADKIQLNTVLKNEEWKLWNISSGTLKNEQRVCASKQL